ncbi:Gp35 protein [Listeria monocytogenes HCC23]|uniref:Gp35 protein n=2 Tax=Listeriaceae TaxID=186820 RepID=A0A0E0USZ6_LISMM|nr:Gp35 protein [Listeria monocytogenes HCC23]AEH91090.1 Gp35 protein [Listeria monocytogenes M7]CAR82782.1 hypothetical protein lmo4a_0080 [Listeria monocytogenes L99]
MRFREGDKVEFIQQGELTQGVVTEIEDTGHSIFYQIDYARNTEIIWITEDKLLPPAPVLKVPQRGDRMRHKIVQVGFLADKGEELIKLLDDGWKILTATYVGDNIEQIGGLVQYVLRKEVAE